MPIQTLFPIGFWKPSLLNGLVSYWKLNESSGNRLDSIGSNTLAPTNTPGSTSGKVIDAASFVRTSSQYLSIASNASLQMGDINFFIAFWVKPTTIAATQDYVGKYAGGGNNREYAITLGATGASARATFTVTPSGTGTGLQSVSTAVGSITVGDWHLIIAYHDAINNLIGISINGGSFTTAAFSAGVYAGTAAFAIGRVGAEGYADAIIDEVGVWKGVVPNSEHVALLWNGGSGLSHPFTSLPVKVTSPTPYQTYQRSGGVGNIPITGRVTGPASDVEARFNGGSWTTIATSVSGSFSATLSGQTPGQGVLEVRKTSDTASVARIDWVGVGDVFIIAGQSNASGRGTSSQVYTHATLRAVLFGNDYVWKNLTDPTDRATNQVDSVSNDSAFNPAGSVWPLIATSFLTDQSVPCAFVPCAMGATVINDWLLGANHQDRATLYGSMVYRALQTGCKAVLWWQGEYDAVVATSQSTYNARLDTIANAINTDLGVKLMPCKLQTFTAATQVQQDAINAAIAEAWGDNTNILTGPDLTGLSSAPEDTYHLITNAKLTSAAGLWWTALETVFYP